MLMAVFCLGASLIGINAQEKDWANLQRYAQQNAELPKPDKNEKRVVFMGNSITQGWISTSRLAVPIEWATGSEKKALSAQTIRSHILATM